MYHCTPAQLDEIDYFTIVNDLAIRAAIGDQPR